RSEASHFRSALCLHGRTSHGLWMVAGERAKRTMRGRMGKELAVKITRVVVNVVRVPVERSYTAGGRTVDANWHVLARLTTSDGVEGFGYVLYPRPDLMTAIGHAARELGESLIGMSVLEPEAACERRARRGDWVGPRGLLRCA